MNERYKAEPLYDDGSNVSIRKETSMRKRRQIALLALAVALICNLGCTSYGPKIPKAAIPVLQFVMCEQFPTLSGGFLTWVVGFGFGCEEPFLLRASENSRNAAKLRPLGKRAVFEAKIKDRCGMRVRDSAQFSEFLQAEDSVATKVVSSLQDMSAAQEFSFEQQVIVEMVAKALQDAKSEKYDAGNDVLLVELVEDSVKLKGRNRWQKVWRLDSKGHG